MKYLIISGFLVILLLGCATQNYRPTGSLDTGSLDSWIAKGNLEEAYRIIEVNYKIYDEAGKSTLRKYVEDYPQLFSTERASFDLAYLRKFLSAQRDSSIPYEIERKRLVVQELMPIALEPSAVKVALDNLDILTKEYAKRLLVGTNTNRPVEVPEASYVCETAEICRKAFELAQVYLLKETEMKIQISNSVLVETYNPTKDSYKLGGRVLREPSGGEAETIYFQTFCSDKDPVLCSMKRRLAHSNFESFISERLAD